MSAITFEVLFILLLLAANGVLAMSELAIVSSRKARLQRMAAAGDARARAALELANSPNNFLSTIQIGITLVGILAGAFGGATIAEQLGVQIARVPALAEYGETVGLGIVVLAITYLSLVVGELVPKRLALNNPERVARAVARPMVLLSRVASPFVHVLSISTSAVLHILRLKASNEPPVTEEEIKVLIEQGAQAGVILEAEQEMVESVFKLADRRVGALMTPRTDIAWLNVNDPPEKLYAQISASPYSRFPVCLGALDKVIGVVKAKDLLARCASGEPLDLRAVMRRPLFVPDSRSALQVLEAFKGGRTHLALLVDEYGAVEGLVTTNDVLEAIVGDIAPSGAQGDDGAVRRDDGSWLLDGSLPVEEFKEIFPVGKLPGEERSSYHTLAGFVMSYLGRIPGVADHFEWQGLRFEVVDMDGKRIDKVLVAPAGKTSSAAAGERD
jgi:putative hemolysin